VTLFSFRLYVIGDTPRSRAAEQGLRRLCAERLGDAGCEIEVVDVEQRRDVADERRIVVTPTLDKLTPRPAVRVVGDLGSSEELADALGLPAEPHPPSPDLDPGLTHHVLQNDDGERIRHEPGQS
jgi:circadian clock protein KaiB